MIQHDSITEKSILTAAKEVFTTRGYRGATVRAIAAQAGVNPAMVNYYFRSKERLFLMIFDQAFKELFARMGEEIFGQGSLFEKIERICSAYIETLDENPDLPIFILSELVHNPSSVIQVISKRAEIARVMEVLRTDIEKDEKKGIIRKTEPIELCVNIISLAVFPVAVRPILAEISSTTKISYQPLLDNRAKKIAQFVINAIKI